MCIYIYIYMCINKMYFIGCHEDMNCASETGSPATDATDCCKQRNKRSYRNPVDGTCQDCEGNI